MDKRIEWLEEFKDYLPVFGYIFAMEIVSILENYGEINPQAHWINKIVAKFGVFKDKED